MTKKLVFFLLFSLFSLGFVTAAVQDPIIVKSVANESHLHILLANLEGVQTQITLHSLDKQQELWSTSVKDHNGFSYDIALADLEYGRYYLEITKADVVRKQVILINAQGISLSTIK